MNLLEHIEECKTKINNLPGIENSNIEQLNKYDEEIKVVNQRRYNQRIFFNTFIYYIIYLSKKIF